MEHQMGAPNGSTKWEHQMGAPNEYNEITEQR